MTKIQSFNVEYENDAGRQAVYFPGQTVKGKVTVFLKKPVKIWSIRLITLGKGHISWIQPRYSSHKDVDGSNHFHGVAWYYYDNETYLNIEIILLDSTNNNNVQDQVIDAGLHTLPFSFQIPEKCPSSFESRKGYIRYFCKAVIDIPWQINYTTQRAFTVAAPIDLNIYPDLQMAKSEPKTKTVYGFLGLTKSGDVQYELKLPRTGYVPGETVPFEIKVDNNSSISVSQTSVTLLEKVTIIARNKHTKTLKRKVVNIDKGAVEPKQVLTWVNDSLKVPPVSPTLLDCRILKIEYFLELRVTSKGLHLSDSVEIPLFIGNIPLRSVMPVLNEKFKSQTHQINTTIYDWPIQSELYPELALPCYEEVVFGESQIKEHNKKEKAIDQGQTSFAPRYAYYDWSNDKKIMNAVNNG